LDGGEAENFKLLFEGPYVHDGRGTKNIPILPKVHIDARLNTSTRFDCHIVKDKYMARPAIGARLEDHNIGRIGKRGTVLGRQISVAVFNSSAD
jgi:hypothetical protein